jgi:hypothetical protein
MRTHFFAPWSNRLKLFTAGFVLVGLVAMVAAQGWGSLVILAIFLFAAAFAVRGYSVLDGKVLIHHLGWSTKYELAELSSAEVVPGATMGSVRTFGIGGLFSFAGRFHNEILGSYRSFATNEHNTVVLDFAGKKVVVTPDEPQEFVEVVEAAADVA